MLSLELIVLSGRCVNQTTGTSGGGAEQEELLDALIKL